MAIFMSVSWLTGVQLVVSLLQFSNGVVRQTRDLQMSQHVVSVEFSSLLH